MKLLVLSFLFVQAVFCQIQGDVDVNAEVSVDGKLTLAERLAALRSRIEALEVNRERIMERINKSPELVSRLEALSERLATAAAKLGQSDRLNQLDVNFQRPPTPVRPVRPQVVPVRPPVVPVRPQVATVRPPVVLAPVRPQVLLAPPQVAAEVSVDQVGSARYEY